jgi:sarcosine oxidase subunit beta
LRKNIVICGAGIAGVSAAYNLAVQHGINEILLVDQNPPLSLTSDQSTECYRNWWPGPDGAMIALMNRSIDIMERISSQSKNFIHMNRRGYLYLTADSVKIPDIISDSQMLTKLGAGPLRIHQSSDSNFVYKPEESDFFQDHLTGADLILNRKLIERNFPFLSEDIAAALYVRRAGWLSAQQLGMYLLQNARNQGVEYLQARVQGIELKNQRIDKILLNEGTCISTKVFVNAAGPFMKDIGNTMGLNIPVFCELHKKASINDHQKIIPREMPLIIWLDTQFLPWTEQEHHEIESDPDLMWLLEEFPSGVHTRPEGGLRSETILMLWEYETKKMDPEFPIPEDEFYPDLLIRGIQKMIPGMAVYTDKIPKPLVDGGYYTKTLENRPIIGHTHIEGSYILGALSGFGIMAACAAGELLALEITGKPLPDYAPKFWLNRFEDPEYIKVMEDWDNSGQL